MAYDLEVLASAVDAIQNGEELSEEQQRVLELYQKEAPGQGRPGAEPTKP